MTKSVLTIIGTILLGALSITIFVGALVALVKIIEFLFTNRISLAILAVLAVLGLSFLVGSLVVSVYKHKDEIDWETKTWQNSRADMLRIGTMIDHENRYPDLKMVDLEKKDE